MKIDMCLVGELMSRLSRNLTTEARFRFNMSSQDALTLLAAAYCTEVQRRQRSFVLDANTENNLIKFAEYLTREAPKFGVMCCGTCGNGKTTLLYAFQRTVNYLQQQGHFSFLDTDYSRFKAGIQIFTAKELTQIAKDYKSFKEIRQRPMLAIDDLGAEPTEILDYGNIISPIVELLEYRYNKQLFTFVTTNLVAQGRDPNAMTIRKKYGARIADRFNEMFEVIVFKSVSYRERKE